MMKTDQKANKNIRKDDTVLVCSGNCKGQVGKVFRREGDKVYVQGLNKAKKHVKKSQRQGGGIIEMERPIHVSNVCIAGKENTPVKLKVRTTSKGERELYYKENGQEVTHRTLTNKNRTSAQKD